jgi:glucosylceramidase
MMKQPIILLFLSLVFACSPKTGNSILEKKQSFNSQNRKTAAVFVTADSTKLRLSRTETLDFQPFGQPTENQPCVFVDASQQFQTFVGIGGALTDAAAETFFKLPIAQQNELLTAYFDVEKGIGYSVARTNINSCDFSSGSYTYVAEGDKSLKTFSLAHDEQFKMPFIKKAIAATRDGKLPLLVSPWSPPAWMKSNKTMLQGGQLLPEFADAWSNYYVKFIQNYEKQGIPIWGLSVQNEPMATQKWESCIFSAQEETDFIKNHLGPTLKKNGLTDKKLIAWDHNRDLIYQRAATYLNDSEAAKYIWGIGFHWYEIWNGGRQYDNVKRVSEAFPDKKLLLTEACNYPFSWKTIDDWTWGEQYGENMIQDFNNGAVAWMDWNVLLDETGGPNHVGNFCFAPIHAETQKGTLYYMNSYYYIGHFSKYIQPGARRIVSASSRAQLLTTAFLNPDGKITVVVMNETREKINYRLCFNGHAAETVSLPHSIMTMVF